MADPAVGQRCTRSDRVRILVLLSLLAVLTSISFWPILNNGFVNWDDNVYLTQNPRAKNFTPEKIPQIFTSFERVQYKPLSFLAFALENRFFRLDPRGYHAVSLLLHLINVFLVFWLFFLLRRDIFLAWFVAVLFAILPSGGIGRMVTEQKDLLYGFFSLRPPSHMCFTVWVFPCFILCVPGFLCSLLDGQAHDDCLPLLLFFSTGRSERNLSFIGGTRYRSSSYRS
jgi:hypothetical protein